MDADPPGTVSALEPRGWGAGKTYVALGLVGALVVMLGACKGPSDEAGEPSSDSVEEEAQVQEARRKSPVHDPSELLFREGIWIDKGE